MKTYSFQEQVIKAEQSEEDIIQYYKKLSNVIAVNDLRHDVKYQHADIDFHAVVDRNSIYESRMYEVKVDFVMASTGNFFIEPEEGLKPGWLSKTRAEEVLYLDYHRALLYYLNTNNLRRYVYSHADDWQSRTVTTGDFGGYNVRGWLVPYTKVVNELNPLVIDFKKYLR